jgi:hypothetical protein
MLARQFRCSLVCRVVLRYTALHCFAFLARSIYQIYPISINQSINQSQANAQPTDEIRFFQVGKHKNAVSNKPG